MSTLAGNRMVANVLLAVTGSLLVVAAISVWLPSDGRRSSPASSLVSTTASSPVPSPILSTSNPPTTRFELPAGKILIKAMGRDFVWDFRLAGPDGQFDTRDDIPMSNDLHLPLDRDVVLVVTSDDNVYTLSIPALQLRRIAVPELTYTLEFHTTTPGSFDVVMDPMCSARFFQDGPMGRLTIQPRGEFEAWLARVPAAPLPQQTVSQGNLK